jgi:hypothetical protein
LRDEAAQLQPLWEWLAGRRAILAGLWLSPLTARLAAMAAACGGRFTEAEAHFETALRQADELPHLIEQPEVRRWYAAMLLQRGETDDRARAGGLLAEAMAQYRALGMPRHVGLAEELLARA